LPKGFQFLEIEFENVPYFSNIIPVFLFIEMHLKWIGLFFAIPSHPTENKKKFLLHVVYE
jgi:hypothetical protein